MTKPPFKIEPKFLLVENDDARARKMLVEAGAVDLDKNPELSKAVVFNRGRFRCVGMKFTLPGDEGYFVMGVDVAEVGPMKAGIWLAWLLDELVPLPTVETLELQDIRRTGN